MKTITKILTTLTVSLSLVGMANASNLVANDDSITTQLCMAAASGKRTVLHNTIKNSGLSKSFIVYNVKCNDKNITDFVVYHGESSEKINAVLNRARTKGKVSINDVAAL